MESEGWEEEMVPWEGSGPESRGRAQLAAGHQAGPPAGTPAGTLSSSDIFYCCMVCVRPVVKPRHRGWKETQPTQFSDEAVGQACPDHGDWMDFFVS